VTAFNTNGFSLGSDSAGTCNTNGDNYVSWTFRKQAKFFDVVTYTGNGTAGRTVSHNLGSTPGCIIIKRTDSSLNWYVYHRYDPTKYLVLNQTAAAATFAVVTATSDTTFTLPNDGSTNGSGATYVAYLFAHDAGGFGATGSDNVISCGSYAGNGSASGVSVNLGYEPQWVLRKRVDSADSGNANWILTDIMRGITIGGNDKNVYTNLTNSEGGSQSIDVDATGFTAFDTGTGGYNQSGATYIYIAIRRGLMKTPTSGTSVFNTSLWVGNASTQNITGVGFSPDLLIGTPRNFQYGFTFDKLRGPNKFFTSTSNGAETATSVNQDLTAFLQDGFSLGTPFQTALNNSATNQVMWNFRRASGFLDVVCYTGTGVARTITHNLNAVPELMIVKTRSTGGSNRGWWTYVSALGNANALELQNTNASQIASIWNSTTPTSSVFSVDGSYLVNENTTTYVAYLFATVAGVSKVGSYTGTGTTQQINCGFTSSARFVLIKRTDTLGDWYVWDSARGIVAGNDPYLLLNSSAAEATGTDYIDSYSLGFEISSTAPSGINANGGTYIFLAIA
jgi:hypothetical protein